MTEQDPTKEKKLPTPRKCPVCKTKLIFKEPGWGWCDSCCAEITYDPPKKVRK